MCPRFSFVPGTSPVKSPGRTRGRPKTNRTKKFMFRVVNLLHVVFLARRGPLGKEQKRPIKGRWAVFGHACHGGKGPFQKGPLRGL